jgi:hypothetical protein
MGSHRREPDALPRVRLAVSRQEFQDMFTLEIDGVAVAMTDADEAEAREIFDSEDFKADLADFTTDGKPVWDGKTPFTVRPATEDEEDLFDDSLEADDEDDLEDEDEDEDEDGASVVFLVVVDQFDDEFDDEDE